MPDADDLKALRAAVLDMDGVLWRGSVLFPGTKTLFDFFREQQIPFVLATNNSTRTVADYVEKLRGMGLAVLPENIITSAVATADYLVATYGKALRVFVVGESGLHQTLLEAGLTPVMSGADVVVAGMDRDLTYNKLLHASLMIRNGARFIGTNGDVTFPLPEGLAPGAGTVLAALQVSSGQTPFVIGKPEPTMFEMALNRLGVSSEEAVMIGDRLETDILGGQRAGLRTALMLSGVTTLETLGQSEIKPDMVFDDVGALCHTWQQLRVREGRFDSFEDSG